MNLAELDTDLEGFADFGEIAIDRGVGNLLSPAVFTERRVSTCLRHSER
jgi:hypothetical protein